MKRFKNILVLAPHPDDGEFGCGGSIHKLHENKAIIHYAAFSPCIASIPKEKNKQILFDELSKATSHLGINNKNIHKYDFPVRKFSEHRQEILEELIKLKNNLNPEVSLDDGLIAVAIGEAAEKSIKLGRLINLEEIIN